MFDGNGVTGAVLAVGYYALFLGVECILAENFCAKNDIVL